MAARDDRLDRDALAIIFGTTLLHGLSGAERQVRVIVGLAHAECARELRAAADDLPDNLNWVRMKLRTRAAELEEPSE